MSPHLTSHHVTMTCSILSPRLFFCFVICPSFLLVCPSFLPYSYLPIFCIYPTLQYVQTWKAMEKLKESGKVKNIGISNFSQKETERLIASATIKPAVIQMEIHPHLAQVDYIKWLQGQGSFSFLFFWLILF